jgi:lysophospholipase L1-like esterase
MHRSSFLAFAGAALAVRPAPASASTGAPVRIAVLGDSLALGTGASRADGGFIFPAFRRLLQQRPGSRLDNFAIGGATTADVLRLQVPRLAGTSYDIAIVCAGGNDVVRLTPLRDFTRTYEALLRRMQSLAPHAHIVCCGVPDVGASPIFSSDHAAIAKASARDNAAVRSAASRAGAAFVDLYGRSRSMHDTARLLSNDRFHPSDRGYALFSAALSDVIAQR